MAEFKFGKLRIDDRNFEHRSAPIQTKLGSQESPTVPTSHPGPSDLRGLQQRGPAGESPPTGLCPPIPPPGGHATNNRFLFLREIGGPGCLNAFLENVTKLSLDPKNDDHPLVRGTLIIDQTVKLAAPITIPPRYVLAGVGQNGRGLIQVVGSFGSQPAIRLLHPFSTLRDIDIEGGGINSGALGIDQNQDGHIYLQNVRVSGFAQYGLKARDVASVFIDKCQFDSNQNNMLLFGTPAFGIQSWRIRDSHIRAAFEWGIRTQGPGTDFLVEGCRFEANRSGAIRLGKEFKGAVIVGNRFENNRTPDEIGKGVAGRSVRVDPGATSTRILCNFMEGDVLVPTVPAVPKDGQGANQATQIGFNVSDTLNDAKFRAPGF